MANPSRLVLVFVYKDRPNIPVRIVKIDHANPEFPLDQPAPADRI